ncbi:MAG: aminopeptidase P family N-terminal domain-containing protein [Bacteroidota bacterium]
MISAKVAQMIGEMPADIAGDLNFSTDEYLRRYKRVREAMKKKKIDALLVCGSSEFFSSRNSSLRYFTGPNVKAGLGVNYAIIPLKGREALVTTNGPQLFSFLSTYPRIPIEPIASPPKKGTLNVPDHAKSIINYLKTAGLNNSRLGISSMDICPAEVYMALHKAFPETELVDAFDLVNDVRQVKSEEEMTFLRRSAFIADVGMTALIEYVRPGVSINECLRVVDNAMIAAGATSTQGFNTIGGGTFPDQMERSFRGSPYRYRTGDIVTNELTSEYKGYYTQISKPVSLGTEPNQAFQEYEKINKIIYETLYAKFRPGVKVHSELDETGSDLAKRMSDGAWGCIQSVQPTDLDQTSHQSDVALQPGVSYTLMPWTSQTQGWNGSDALPPIENWSGYAWGNTLICTKEEPIVLHQTELGMVIKTEFDEILKVPELEKEPTDSADGNWKISFFMNLSGAQEKEMKVSEEGAFVDGNAIPFTFDDGSVAFELTIGTLQGPQHLEFKGWMIGNEIAGAFNLKDTPTTGQRNRFKAVR